MVETPSQKNKKSQGQEDPGSSKENPLQQQIDDLKRRLSEKESKAEIAAQEAAKEKKQSEEQQKKQELQAASDIKSLLEAAGDEVVKKGEASVEDLSNRQIIDLIVGSVDKALNARSELTESSLREELKANKEALKGIRKALGQMVAENRFNAVRSSHKDFDDYKKELMQIYEQYPTIDPEDAYALAKTRSAKKVPAKENTDTEKPDESPEGESGFGNRQNTGGHQEGGVTSFRAIADKALDKVLAEMNIE